MPGAGGWYRPIVDGGQVRFIREPDDRQRAWDDFKRRLDRGEVRLPTSRELLPSERLSALQHMHEQPRVTTEMLERAEKAAGGAMFEGVERELYFGADPSLYADIEAKSREAEERMHRPPSPWLTAIVCAGLICGVAVILAIIDLLT